MKTGIQLIAAERRRAIKAEGFGSKHDDRHTNAELGRAGRCYARMATMQVLAPTNPGVASEQLRKEWPFEQDWWRPSTDPVRNLAKAGALIAAEIDRLNRAKAKKARRP